MESLNKKFVLLARTPRRLVRTRIQKRLQDHRRGHLVDNLPPLVGGGAPPPPPPAPAALGTCLLRSYRSLKAAVA